MLVADTSALLSLATGETAERLFEEFETHTTRTVLGELYETSRYDDVHGEAARSVLAVRDRFEVHTVESTPFTSSRIDVGEGSCVALTAELDAEFLLTDDLRALPELQQLTEANVAISPIVLKSLVERDVIAREEALRRLDRIGETRDWLETPIYRRARRLFD